MAAKLSSPTDDEPFRCPRSSPAAMRTVPRRACPHARR